MKDHRDCRWYLALGILCIVSGVARAQVSQQDSLALVAIYNAANGIGWLNSSNWLVSSVALWQGVSVTNDRVTSLDLHNRQLSGLLPKELGDLTKLTVLDISTNPQLKGEIPQEIGNLTALEIVDFQDNRLSETIPIGLGNLDSLRALLLKGNLFSGAVPTEVGNLTRLTVLDISGNPLTGSIPISFVNLVQLRDFSFEKTDLCEPIDADFQTWLQNVSTVTSTGVVCIATENEGLEESSLVFMLNKAYPNPLSHKATISYEIPIAARVRLSIYDVLGRLVRSLVNEFQLAGTYRISLEASSLPAGIYYYQMEAGQFIATRPVTILR